ncbi:hypothetical protein KP509_04G040500 [Ceratopteris richardii]|uniref:Uncharacterized protein n=1 Tax=Ceratopteris richardii TaxID=49495 RepID=A0A8T2UUP4_CERRI|nr:hypothetical protein KP509_04G040500 [Ceratopteris richardii]
MMPFVGKANHKKNLDHALDGKLSFMSQAPLESQNALCSTSPSSDSCGVLPSFCYSMDMLSPPCLSSRNLPSETIPSELDAELHAYEEASSSMPQMTFCNPVYDCDSGRGNSESVARPGTFPCDTDEDQRASVFHGSASIRNHLDDYRELGSDNKSNGSFSQTGPHIVEHPDVRENGVHQKDASVIADSSKDSLQVAKLSKKMVSFQRMLDELKKTIESSSIHVQEQVDICDTRLKDIETQLSEVKKKTYSDLEDLKGYVRQQPGGKNVNCCNQSIEEKLHSKMEECYLNFRNFQKEIESWISKLEEHLRRKVEDALAICGEKYSRTIKEGIEKLEPHRILELGNPKKEMGVRLCLQENKKELELVVEEVLSKQLSHLLKTFFAEDRESHQIKNDVRYLQNENEMNLKARVEVQKHSETLSHLKRSLQNIRNEGIQVKLLADDIKKKTSLRFHDMRMSIDMLKLEAVECKNRILGLEKLISAEPNVDPRENVKNLHNLRMRPSPSKFYFSVSERS